MPWTISRFTYDSTPTIVGSTATRLEANELIAKLEDADPKGSLVFYSRVEVKDATTTFRSVKRVALALATSD